MSTYTPLLLPAFCTNMLLSQLTRVRVRVNSQPNKSAGYESEVYTVSGHPEQVGKPHVLHKRGSRTRQEKVCPTVESVYLFILNVQHRAHAPSLRYRTHAQFKTFLDEAPKGPRGNIFRRIDTTVLAGQVSAPSGLKSCGLMGMTL